VSAAFLKIARSWSHGGLIFALLWVTAQLPVPVLHAHGRHPAAAHELPLGQHVERCHGSQLVADFLDWHIHWFSPQTVLKGCRGGVSRPRKMPHIGHPRIESE